MRSFACLLDALIQCVCSSLAHVYGSGSRDAWLARWARRSFLCQARARVLAVFRLGARLQGSLSYTESKALREKMRARVVRSGQTFMSPHIVRSARVMLMCARDEIRAPALLAQLPSTGRPGHSAAEAVASTSLRSKSKSPTRARLLRAPSSRAPRLRLLAVSRGSSPSARPARALLVGGATRSRDAMWPTTFRR